MAFGMHADVLRPADTERAQRVTYVELFFDLVFVFGLTQPRARFGVVYVPMGAVMNNWTPAATGAGFSLSPILEPIGTFRDRMLVLTNLDNEPAVARLGEPAGGHGRIGGAFLTGVHAKPTEGVDFEAGISIDQIAARHLGQQTQLA